MPPTVHTLRLELRVVPGGDDRATGASASTGTRAWAAHTPDGERLGVLELAPRYEDDRPDAPAWWYGPVLRDGAWGSGGEGGRREDALLHEAAIATVEALLDAEGWATPLRMREDDCGALHPSKLGYQRRAAADAAAPDATWWCFDPDQDALRADAIVVAVSGGGLRATGFALGAFTALHQADALDRVRAVTSVSGGSIFTGAWLAGAARGLDFPTTAARLRAFLVGDDAPDPPRAPTWLDLAPGTFRYDASWRPLPVDPRDRDAGTQPAPTLTRRLADFLAAGLLAGPSDATLRLGDGARGSGPSPDGGAPTGGAPAAWPAEVVFQSTELTRGGSFVLAATPEGRVQQGISPRLRLPAEAWREVRLADAVAASAAFPVGFEPMAFPRDFDLPETARSGAAKCLTDAVGRGAWPDASAEAVLLVDGGVFDNQGIRAGLNAAARHDADLLVVIDADVSDPGRPILTARAVRPWPSLLGLLGVVTALSAALLWLPRAALLAPPLLALVATPPLVMRYAQQLLPAPLDLRPWRSPLGFARAVRGRVAVAAALLDEVFMRRVRSLSYTALYARDSAIRHRATPVLVRARDLPGIRSAAPHTLQAAFRARCAAKGAAIEAAHVEQASRAAAIPTTLRLPGDRDARHALADAAVATGWRTLVLKLVYTLHRSPRPRTPATRQLLARLEALWASDRNDAGAPPR